MLFFVSAPPKILSRFLYGLLPNPIKTSINSKRLMKEPNPVEYSLGESDGEGGSYSGLISAQNRKHKKSGGWQSLGLDSNVFCGIQKKGYRQPTPIQRKTIPLILEGKDVVAMARTGSGKTAAFLVPLFQKLKCRFSKSGARAVLISPTRELALQTFRFTKEIGKYCRLRAALIVGGDSMEDQFSAIHENPDILIATPGRLLHLVVEMNLLLNSVQYVVFDEADRLFEMGFLDQLKEILHRLPESRQTLLFSATMPRLLVDFARAGLNDPTLVRLDVDTKVSDQLEMVFLSCRAEEKLPTLLYLIRNILNSTGEEQTIIFCATKHHVEYLKEILEQTGFSVSYLYSSLDPAARKINISRFQKKETKILVVTDVAARGVDIPLLDNAVNFHFPSKSKLFVHRVGRVARAGRKGRAFSLISADEFPYLLDLYLFLGRTLTCALKGERAVKTEDLGSVPQSVIESELDILTTLHTNNFDLEALKKVADNAMKNYLKTRPGASLESLKRTRKDPNLNLTTLLGRLAPHTIFDDSSEVLREDSDLRSTVLDGIKKYKPGLTVFELNTSNKHYEWSVMKAKRRAHQKYIDMNMNKTEPSTSFQEEAGVVEPKGIVRKLRDTCSQEYFTEIIAPNRNSGTNMRKKQKRRKPERDQSEYFLPNRPTDFHSEQGLAVDRENNFDQATKQSVLDFTADDEQDMKKQKQTKVWDRKKKKFVGKSGEDGKMKKIRTESGILIPASYKSGRYSKWKKRQRVQSDESDEEEEDRESENRKRTTVNQRNRFGKRGKWGKSEINSRRKSDKLGVPRRSELKSKEQILKQRKRKQKIENFQKFRRKKKLEKKPHVKGKTRGRK